jgi:drug/metabolite transporter (DMT)-like permease
VLESDTIVIAPMPVAEELEAAQEAQQNPRSRHTPLRSIGLVLLCTVIGAAAQIFLRYGAEHLTGAGIRGVLTNWPLLAGYVCLGINTLLLIVALRNGQLSVLYPIIALTYVWVTILSPIFFADTVNFYKIVGVFFIVLGVSFIGAGSRS